MEWIKYILYATAAFVIYLNILASISLLKAEMLTKFQKIGQGLFIWLVPILGSKFVLHLLSEDEPSSVNWIPQKGHGWLIIAGVYRESLHGRAEDNSSFDNISQVDSSDGSSD